MSKILQTHPSEVARAVRNEHYRRTKGGIILRGSGVFLGGALKVRDYRDDTDQLVAIDNNALLTEGLVHALNVLMPPTGGYAQLPNWYIAPFSGNYTPDATLTAATFRDTATEFIAYTNATRLALVVAAAATTPTTGNTGNEAMMTFSAGGPYNIYGAAILSASAKNNTGGKGLAAVRLDNPRLGMVAGDRLGWEYVLTAADADA